MIDSNYAKLSGLPSMGAESELLSQDVTENISDSVLSRLFPTKQQAE